MAERGKLEAQVLTPEGEVFSGELVQLSTRTAVGEVVVPKADIVKREKSAKSLMPEGLMESLSDREQLELLKYLVGH